MEHQVTLFKGEQMEELVRNYFLTLGYYVVRGIKYKYEGIEITDVDVYLYMRSSTLSRERINVDLKNKKSPQTFERILWANGLRKLLGFDSCIVATTDQRPVIHSYGQLHETTILDGAFLAKLKTSNITNRLTEEDLLLELSKCKSYKTFANRDWRYIYDLGKSRLLSEQDFSGFNATLETLRYFVEKVIVDDQKRTIATRMVYITLSQLLIIIDYIIKDIAFLEQPIREKVLSDGFKFGNLGKGGADKILAIATQISGNKSSQEFLRSLDNIPTDILKEFFGKNDNVRNLFQWAKELEAHGFNREFIDPNQIDTALKGILSVILDFTNVDRKKFFNAYGGT
ncbi:MAG: hypothetical protein JNM57_10770 [Cyclobacteriaceae bacterium]|nr:hypothetical protein [Cyclobacteriaceae bacterium]